MWADNLADRKILAFLESLRELDFLQLITVSTHTAGHRLEWIMPNLLEVKILEVIPLIWSDHSLILFHSGGIGRKPPHMPRQTMGGHTTKCFTNIDTNRLSTTFLGRVSFWEFVKLVSSQK